MRRNRRKSESDLQHAKSYAAIIDGLYGNDLGNDLAQRKSDEYELYVTVEKLPPGARRSYEAWLRRRSSPRSVTKDPPYVKLPF